jgi:response regulator RpfG family c-di-GMP phosphodiesterase
MTTTVNRRVLLVDDDEALLAGLKRAHRKHYDITVAYGGQEAIEIIQKSDPFAVIVSDFSMPEMTGTDLLMRVKHISPNSIRIMLTGNGESQTAIDAINRGEIFRFLNKPCHEEVFRTGINLAIEQFRLIHLERSLLEQTLRGSVKVLVDVLSLISPDSFGRSVRLQSYVQQLTKELELDDAWLHETAALVSQIGLVSVPKDILELVANNESLTEEQDRIMQRHPRTARDLLSKIPRMEQIAEIVGAQDDRYSDSNKGTPPTLGACILKLAIDFDALIERGAASEEAIAVLKSRPDHYHPRVLVAAKNLRKPGDDATMQTLTCAELRIGMVLEMDIVHKLGRLIVRRGQVVTQSMLKRLGNYADLDLIPRDIRVLSKMELIPETAWQ